MSNDLKSNDEFFSDVKEKDFKKFNSSFIEENFVNEEFEEIFEEDNKENESGDEDGK